MSRILRIYVIREVALPTLLTLMTILFVMLMGWVYKLITLMMQPSVSIWMVTDALVSTIPSMLILAIPMAILIGVLIGVGRMTLDREMLATRASGINLFSIFAPLILLGLMVSLAMMLLSGGAIPRLLQHGIDQIDKMKYAMISSLEPGQFYDDSDLPGGFQGLDFQLYFRNRDPKDPQVMRGVMIKLAKPTGAAAKAEKAAAAAKDGATSATATDSKSALFADILSSSTLKQATAAGAAQDAKNSSPTLDRNAADTATAAEDTATSAAYRRNELTLITAESGVIAQSASPNKKIVATQLNLKQVTIHELNPENNQYMVSTADAIHRPMFSAVQDKKEKAMTNQELRKIINSAKKQKDRGDARRELIQRYSISLASFVFFLVGIPLAIWVKPSGKSWGILLAIGLMLAYHLLSNTGLYMVQYGKPLGILVAFSPNLLFVVLGAGLWWHAVRS